MARARSNYKQVRVTITEEQGDLVTVRIMVKPLDADWKTTHTVWHHRFKQSEPSVHWVDLVAVANDVVLAEVLPPSR